MDVDPAALAPLAGKVTVSVSDAYADFFTRNQVAVRAEHDLRPQGGVYGAMVVVPRSVLEDAPMMRAVVEGELLRRLKPWLDPDANPFPRFVPFPRAARTYAWLRRRLATW